MTCPFAAHGQCACNIAQDAYELALTSIQTEFADDRKALTLICGKTNIEDIEVTVASIKKTYEDRPGRWKGVREILHQVSLRVVYYGKIFDALAQHHPEYVSLAWGTLKFVLMGIINHAELVEELALALTNISSALAEAVLSAELYHTDAMTKAVASLYTDIITFFIKVAKWYKKRRIQRAISAIAKPFQLDYQDTCEKIRKSSKDIEKISRGQSRKELRLVSTAIPLIQADIEQMKSQIEGFFKFQTKTGREIQVSLQDMQPRIRDIQYGGIVAALKPSIEPAEMLYTNQLLIQRRQSKLGPSYSASAHLANLHQWANCPSSSLLVLQPNAGADFAVKEMSVDIINHLRAAKKMIFWSLSAYMKEQPVLSTETILKTLLFQVAKATAPEALLNASSSSSSSPQGLNVANASAGHSESEWLEILKRSIARHAAGGCCFVVVECVDLYRAHAGQSQWVQAFPALFHALADGVQASGSRVKVLVVNSDKSDAGWRDHTGESPRIVAPVRRSAPLPPKVRRRWMRGAGRR
ncbi:hypothetical protein DIS24_g11089 [Lasiodiplodia hormozganensis]|uniref:DUF7708 domain-containing protein n=1 Tax=Lasiodiplodia hormozganensis TaxID=869390 RepID=A0AA39X1M5_9PEZI|nr:hypothetical protein DIS24_g11089 [Lasiodiplodia hormozganensis]